MRDTTRRRLIAVGGAVGLSALAGCLDAGPAGDDGTEADDADQEVDHEQSEGNVEIVDPEDGDTVESPFTVEMDVEDFELVPTDEGPSEAGVEEEGENGADADDNNDDEEAGELADDTGHLHVIVDRDPFEPGEEIPEASGIIHLGDGDTEAEVDLSEGEYDLVAQASDSAHIAFDAVDEISITVENGSENGEHDPDDDGGLPDEDDDPDGDDDPDDADGGDEADGGDDADDAADDE